MANNSDRIEGQAIFSVTIGDKVINLLDDELRSFLMIESLQFFMPTAKLILTDNNAEIIEGLGLAPTDDIIITLGLTDDDIQTYTFNLFSKPKSYPLSKTSPSSSKLILNLMMKGWDKLFKKQKIQSWHKPSSQVIEDIADDCEFKNDIDSVSDNDYYIQPLWTNAQMIRHVANRAKNNYGDGGFIYSVQRNSTLLFYSYRGLYERAIIDKLEFISNDKIDEDDKRIIKDNIIMSYSSKDKSKMSIISKGYGFNIYGYDEENREFKSEELKISDTSYKTLSEKLYMSENEVEPNRYIYEQSFDNANISATSKMITAIANTFELSVIILSNPKIKIGGKVRITIPNILEDEAKDSDIMETLSGDYIVSTISHSIGSNKTYLMKLVLIKDGFDKKLKKDLLKL